MQIVPLRFLSYTKRSVLWPLKYAKIRFRPGLCPDPAGGAHDDPSNPLFGRRGDTHHRTPTPFGTDPPSALAMRPPQNSSQILYAYVCNLWPSHLPSPWWSGEGTAFILDHCCPASHYFYPCCICHCHCPQTWIGENFRQIDNLRLHPLIYI